MLLSVSSTRALGDKLVDAYLELRTLNNNTGKLSGGDRHKLMHSSVATVALTAGENPAFLLSKGKVMNTCEECGGAIPHIGKM